MTQSLINDHQNIEREVKRINIVKWKLPEVDDFEDNESKVNDECGGCVQIDDNCESNLNETFIKNPDLPVPSIIPPKLGIVTKSPITRTPIINKNIKKCKYQICMKLILF